MAKAAKPAAKKVPSSPDGDAKDLVLVHGRAPDGTLHVLRRRGDKVEAGAMRDVEEGKPVTGELVKLTPREEAPVLFDAETLYRAPAGPPAEAQPTTDGPAQVASDAYRKNWSRIFGPAKRRGASDLPN